jgi:hypothetical protein
MLADLSALWPVIHRYLAEDSYFCVNSTYAQSRTKSSVITGLPLYRRTAECMRWLNAMMLDLDIYKAVPDCDFDEAFGLLLDEINRNGLPEPNLICSSGRGIWGLWRVCDEKNRGTPVPACSDKRGIFQRVNRELVSRFVHLGADPGCTDPARVMRVPGSVNTCAAPENRVVQFFKLGDDVHTLPELASILGVKAQKTRLPGEGRTGPKNEAKVKAGRMRWKRPLQGFRQLWQLRGQFQTGVRRYAILIYALLLYRNHIPEPQIREDCLNLASSCLPPLPARYAIGCVRWAKKFSIEDFSYSISNAKIAKMLKITEQEMARLTEWFRPPVKRKVERIAERRGLVLAEICSAGKTLDVPGSLRVIARLLMEKHGLDVTHVTVHSDIQALRESISDLQGKEVRNPSAVKFPVLIDTALLSYTSRENLTVQESTSCNDSIHLTELSSESP